MNAVYHLFCVDRLNTCTDLECRQMRDWIETVNNFVLLEGYYGDDFVDDEGSGEWRAWILPDGTVNEVPDDQTHAEAALYSMWAAEVEFDDLDDSDAAFAHAHDMGWIRVAVPADAHVMIINFNGTRTTKAAIRSTIGLFDRIPVESYAIEPSPSGSNFQSFETEKEAKRFLMRFAR